jgi:hypothetical protein
MPRYTASSPRGAAAAAACPATQPLLKTLAAASATLQLLLVHTDSFIIFLLWLSETKISDFHTKEKQLGTVS